MLKKVVGLLVIVTLLTVVIFNVVTHDLQQDRFLPSLLSLSVSVAVFAFAAAWFFLTGLKTFQPRFKWAYYFLCVGIILLAIAQMQIPFLTLANALNSWWVSTGIVLIPYALSTLLLYFGVYRMAHILTVRPLAARLPIVLLVTAISIAISIALPHLRVAATPGAELSFDIFTSLLVANIVFGIASFLIAKRIKTQLGEAYKSAMKWLSWSYICVIIAAVTEWLYTFFFPEITWYTIYGFNAVPLLITSMATMIAGTYFHAISRTNFINDATFVDVVASAARLASDPKKIAPYLDTIKAINTVLSAGHEPTPAQKHLLATIYLEIENYLVSQDQVRHLSKEELRSQLPMSFITLLNQTTTQYQ